jgi:hypothetical protein
MSKAAAGQHSHPNTSLSVIVRAVAAAPGAD